MRLSAPLLILLAMLSCSTHAVGRTQTAARCGVNQDEPPKRVFADPEGKRWQEYKTIKNVPEIQLAAGTAAFLWSSNDGNTLIAVEEPSEDSTVYTDYCFDRAGHLIQLRFLFHSIRGWEYCQEGRVTNRKFKAEISDFSDSRTKQRIKRPDEDEVPEDLKPHLYLNRRQLPFYKLLSKGGD
jgi:hypothetical protein